MMYRQNHIAVKNATGPDCAGDNRCGDEYTANFGSLQKKSASSGVSGARIGTIIEDFTGFFNYFFLFLHQLENNELKCRSFMTR